MNKKVKVGVAAIIILLVAVKLWDMRGVTVIGGHKAQHGYSDVVVDRLPYSDKAKIEWWLKNRDSIHDKFALPEANEMGNYAVFVWGSADGYLEASKHPHEDLLCFEDMHVAANCIEKNLLLTIRKDGDEQPTFEIDNSNVIYQLSNDGNIVRQDR